jgi:hypothetical protein
VVAAVVVLIGLGVVRLLDQPLELASYRAVDAQTVDVVGFGARTAWTHVTGLTESDTTVTISVNSFTFEPFPHTDAAYRIETLVRLAAPLGNRVVVDGSTGQRIPESAT